MPPGVSWLHANGDAGTWPRTFYAEGLDLPAPCPPLRGAAEADLCVVGAGITGLSAALHAAQAGMSVIVLDAQRVGWGASGRNGGQIGSGFNWDHKKLASRLGREKADSLWTLAEDAKALTRRLISEHAPEADYRPGILHLSQDPRERAAFAKAARAEPETYASLDRAALSDRIGTSRYAGGLLDMSAGFCNPLAYVLGLAQAARAAGAVIHERSEVTSLGPPVRTRHGRVDARFVIHATNGYASDLASKTGARVLPLNNYIAVTEPLTAPPMPDPIAVADDRAVVNYWWQSRDGRLVYGGGESYGKRFPADIERKIRTNLARVYPNLADVGFDYAWGGTLAITATRLPYLAEVAPGVFSAGGYSGHGLALSGLFGQVMVEALLGERSRFDLLTSLPVPALPGGRWLGPWGAQAGMLVAAISDRIRR